MPEQDSDPASDVRATCLKGEPVSYRVKRTHRRWSIGLQIDGRGLIVTVPKRGASIRFIEQVLQDKAEWVLEKLNAWQGRKVPQPAWHEGARMPYLGQELILSLNQADVRGRVLRLDGHFLVTLPDPANESAVEKLVIHWYRQQALALFCERATLYAGRLGVPPPRIRLSSARTRWGSCNENRTVFLNWRLVQRPLKLVDYVVAHELAHLKEMNHSERFWALVAQLVPDYREAKAELGELV